MIDGHSMPNGIRVGNHDRSVTKQFQRLVVEISLCLRISHRFVMLAVVTPHANTLT